MMSMSAITFEKKVLDIELFEGVADHLGRLVRMDV